MFTNVYTVHVPVQLMSKAYKNTFNLIPLSLEFITIYVTTTEVKFQFIISESG